MSCRPCLRGAFAALLEADDLEMQRAICDGEVTPLLWTKRLNWAISHQTTMSLLGVPPTQAREVALHHHDGT